MFPSVRPQLWGLPNRVEYLSPQGVLLPLVYRTTATPSWPELRGHSAWQATPSWTVYRLACHRLLPWLWVTFFMVPDAAWLGSDQWPWSTAPATGPVGGFRPPFAPPGGSGAKGATSGRRPRGLSLAPAEEARLWEDGDAGESLFLDAEPALHQCVAVPGAQHSVVGGRRGEVLGVDVGRGVGGAQGCVSSVG